MTFGSLFSGIGGLDLGLERAGMECRWQVEIDPFCRKVLTRHWPEVPKYGDITNLTGAELETVDLVAGGFPCQDVSLAGLRKGITSDTRTGLYADMLRIVAFLRPTFVLMENVSGLLVPTISGWPAPISRVLGDLAEIGLDAEWQSIPAAAFGAPHIRDRIFIVAYPHGDYGCNAITENSIWRAREAPIGKIQYLRQEEWNQRERIFSGYPDAFVWWDCEPGLDRVANGLPAQMDRLAGCGNAVVPQVAEWIGRRILASSGA